MIIFYQNSVMISTMKTMKTVLPMLLVVLILLLISQAVTAQLRRTPLNIVQFVPLPDRDYHPTFDQGYSIIPAVQLAMEQINNRSDILPEYFYLNVLLRDSGCDKASKTAVSIVSILRELLVNRNGPVGIIGPACSEDSIFVVNMFQSTYRVPVLYSGTSSLLSEEHRKYPSAFGMVSSTATLVDVLVGISQRDQWNWKNVAVLFDDSRKHFQSTYDTLVNQLNGTQQLGYTRLIALSSIPLAELVERNIRIVIVISRKEVTRNLVCLAGHREYNFVFPIHQFVFMETVPKDVLVESDLTFKHLSNNGNTYHCTKQTMIRGLNGSIFLNQALDSVDPNVITVSNYTAGQVKEQYRAKLAEYKMLNNLSSLLEHPLAYAYYDAAWAVALGLQLAFMQPYPSITSYINGISDNISFQGITGWIDFSNQHHVTNPIKILQANGTMAILKGVWNASILRYMSDTFIEEEFKKENISIHISLAILGLVVLVVLTVTIALQIMTVIYRNYPSVKAGSAQLNHFIFLGCYLYLATALSNTIHQMVSDNVNGDVLCNAVFGSNFGFSFIFGTTLAKSWRTYRIFNHVFKTSTSHHYFLRDTSLAVLILCVVTAEVVLFIPAFVLTPLKVMKSFTYDNSRWPPVKLVKSECVFTSFSYFLFPFLFQLCLAFAAIFLATLNRNVKRKYFQTSRQIFMLVYIHSIMWAIGGPLLILSVAFKLSLNITYSFFICLLVATVVLCLVLLIVPTLLPVISGYHIAGNFRGVQFSLFSRMIT